MGGTNLSDQSIQNGGTVNRWLIDSIGNGVLVHCTTANIPSAVAGYAVGCMLNATDTGRLYTNIGTTSSASFQILDQGTAFGLPTSATDATTTTTTSFQLTTSAITTGNSENITAAAITTGAAYKATLGTSLTTGGAFNASLGAAVTGYALTSTTTGVYTGAGLIQLVANSGTTFTALISASATGQTSGTIQLLTGGGANMLTGGIVGSYAMGAATLGSGVKIVTTGVYTDATNAVLNIVASSATTGNIAAVTTTSSNALVIGQALATPAFQVDASTASQVTGLKVTGAATGGTVAVAVIQASGNANLSLDAKGSGTITLNGTGTGNIVLSRAMTGVSVSTTGSQTALSGTAVPATAGAVAAGAPIIANSNGMTIEWTTNAPTHTRPKGSLCLHINGSSSSTRAYINTDGAGTWTAITTAA